MWIEESLRSKDIQNNIFQTLEIKKQELLSEGKEIFDFSIGTPDFRPSKEVMKALKNACDNPDNFKYALKDLPGLIDAVRCRYKQDFNLDINSNMIVGAQGSQDIIAHMALALCDVGDLILVPNPGYPSFSIAPKMMGVEVYGYPLYEKDKFILNFDNIPDDIAHRAKLIILCYPSNPTGTIANSDFYKKAIEWANKHHVIIVHDSAYMDIYFKGKKISFLSFEGANEVGIELYSLSKTYNLTGARVAFMIGNEKIVQAFKRIKSQIDYGIFKPIQYAAIEALTGGQENVIAQRAIYSMRRKTLCQELLRVGWNVPYSEGSLFVWAKIPERIHKTSEEFSLELLEKTGIVVVPGSAFGTLGEGYVRFAVVLGCDIIKQAIDVLEQSKLLEAKDD